MIDLLKHSALPSTGPLHLYPTKTSSGGAGSNSFDSSMPLRIQLKRFDREQSNSIFSSSTFHCSICLEGIKGRHCLRLQRCHHIFCSPCLTDYFSLCISEGLVRNVHCPDPECSTARSKASPSTPPQDLPGSLDATELQAIVGPDLSARYVELEQKQRLESDPSVMSCPRASCQAPVLKDPDERFAKLRECSACGFTFCAFCKRTYHGLHTPCQDSNSIVSGYLEADEVEQSKIEAKYGASLIQRLVKQHQEDQANEDWFGDNTTICPGCSQRIEKSEGCNKVSSTDTGKNHLVNYV